ncbi:D-alanine--D-alanine ligase family protein [Sinorhizobium medicae]
MPPKTKAREVSFIFGGISTEYDASISSLTHIISSYLAIPHEERPFSVKHLYHVSRHDSLVRIIPFRSDFTIAELQAYISDDSIVPGHRLLAIFDKIRLSNEYIVNLLHGQFGEDGGIQTLAALSGLMGTFGDPHVASLTMNKYAMSSFVTSLFPTEVVKVPKTKVVKPQDIHNAVQIATSFGGPIVVKPNSLGASLFAAPFSDPSTSETEILALLRAIFRYDNTALMQEFILGDEYSCGCLIASPTVISLPVVKIEADGRFFGHKEKHSYGLSLERVVDNQDDELVQRLNMISRRIASSIDLFNMARFDFMVTESSDIWFLECNYIPGLMKNSIFPKMIAHYGMTVIDLIVWIEANSGRYSKKNHLFKYDILE